MMTPTPTYDVQRPSGVCVATGRAMGPGEACYSALVDVPEGERGAGDQVGMKRVDVSVGAWEGGGEDGGEAAGFRPPGLFSFWKTHIPQPNEKKKTFVDDAVLLNLLRRLEDATEPQRLAFRYVVALILMRKKLLRYDGSDRVDDPDDDGPGQDWWRFTPKRDVSKGHLGKWDEGETLRVLDPKLDAEQVEAVTAQLGEVLEAEL